MLESGTLLSARYRIQSVLGRGGMGAVYLANVEALGDKKVAVKEMELRGYTAEELGQAVEQFKREASFLANLDHPNLVPVTDYFRVGNKHYLVMGYVEGETLQQKLVKRGIPYTWSELEDWIKHLVEVLSFLHTRNPAILFRDLKPSNIMISKSGRLHLIDFGIARTARVGDKTSTFLQGTGTKGFSPIEQYGEAQSTDQRSDVYALGATLYYLLTGKLPVDAVERVSRAKELMPPSHYEPSVSSQLDSVILKCMAIAQPDRYQSVEQVGVALSGVPGLGSRVSFVPSPLNLDEATTDFCEAKSIKLPTYSTRRTVSPLQHWLSVGVVAASLGLVLLLAKGFESPDGLSAQAEMMTANVGKQVENVVSEIQKQGDTGVVTSKRERNFEPIGLGGRSPFRPTRKAESMALIRESGEQAKVEKRSPRLVVAARAYPVAKSGSKRSPSNPGDTPSETSEPLPSPVVFENAGASLGIVRKSPPTSEGTGGTRAGTSVATEIRVDNPGLASGTSGVELPPPPAPIEAQTAGSVSTPPTASVEVSAPPPPPTSVNSAGSTSLTSRTTSNQFPTNTTTSDPTATATTSSAATNSGDGRRGDSREQTRRQADSRSRGGPGGQSNRGGPGGGPGGGGGRR